MILCNEGDVFLLEYLAAYNIEDDFRVLRMVL